MRNGNNNHVECRTVARALLVMLTTDVKRPQEGGSQMNTSISKEEGWLYVLEAGSTCRNAQISYIWDFSVLFLAGIRFRPEYRLPESECSKAFRKLRNPVLPSPEWDSTLRWIPAFRVPVRCRSLLVIGDRGEEARIASC